MKEKTAVNDIGQIPARFTLRSNHKLDEAGLVKLAALLHTLESNPDDVDALQKIQDDALYLAVAGNLEAFQKLLRPGTSIALSQDETGELKQLEADIERGQKAFLEVANALFVIREKKLYRAEFKTFDQYCRERWGWKRQHAYRLIDAAEVSKDLSPLGDKEGSEALTTVGEAQVVESEEMSPTGDKMADSESKKATAVAKPPARPANTNIAKPTSERQLRSLKKLPQAERAGAWKDACKQSGGKPTGKMVEQAVKRRLQKSTPEPKDHERASEPAPLTILVCKKRKDIPPELLEHPNLFVIETTRIRDFVERMWPDAIKISPGWKEREGWQC